MASNRIAAAHITRNDIRLIEGRTSGGVILVTRMVNIQDVGQFYQGDRLVYLSEMVATIADAMAINGFMAKDLHIVYDNKQQVEFLLDESVLVRSESKLASLTDAFRKKDRNADEADPRVVRRSQIVHEKRWGRFVTESEQGEMQTTSVFERDFVDFLCSEFHQHGIHVASIEAPETAILYLRNMVKFSYNAMNKIVVYANDFETGYFYQFTKDLPSGQRMIHFDMAAGEENFAATVVASITEEMQKKQIYNPYIMLIGDAFSKSIYLEAANALSQKGLFCIDTFGTWDDVNAPLTSIRVGVTDELLTELDGKYGICICLMARALEAKPENMVEGNHLSTIGTVAKNRIADVVLTAALIAIVAGAAIAGVSTYEYYIARQETQVATTATNAKLASAEARRADLRSKTEALATIDERYASVLKFVYAQIGDELNIASVDTEDMIPTTETAGSAYETELTQTENGEVGGDQDVTENNAPKYQQQTIHIRGYSRTTDGPVKLYTALVSVGLGEVRIVGVEQVELPSGDMVFAFELTVGQN